MSSDRVPGRIPFPPSPIQLDSPIKSADLWSSASFLPLCNFLMLLSNFMPSAVQELLQDSSGRERDSVRLLTVVPHLPMPVMSAVWLVEKLTDLPDSWPLMRILIPLDGLSLQIERIIACVAAELSATHLEAKTLGKFVKRVAKKLTAMLACYLAGEVMYHPLLTPGFWVRPIYMELLHASSRLRRDTRVETARPCEDPVHSQSSKGRTDECHPS